MREEGGERDAFFWVRGRTPSLDDPYVWFDPINPGAAAPRSAAEAPADGEAPRDRVEAETGENGERAGRSRRRRGRGRGRDRADRDLPRETVPEARASDEGMTLETSPDTPAAVMVADEAEAPVPVPVPVEEPKRRRVRRKVTAEVAPELDAADTEAVEAPTPEPVAEPEPVIAPAPAPAPVAEPVTPEVDVAALIAEDPNQIVAPPEKPKRGWWRR